MRRRLVVSFVSMTALVLVLLEVPLGFEFARAERRRLETEVQHDAFALALHAEELYDDPTAARRAIQRLAERDQHEPDARVVFVDADGRVVADSKPPPGASSVGRSLLDRPEIRRALGGLDNEGERHSQATGRDVIHVAVPIATRGELGGAVRITYPLRSVNERTRDNWILLAAVGGAILLVVFGLSIVVARSITRPLADLEAGATALGAGDLTRRVDVPDGPRELQTLARSFNTTAARLEQLVGAQEAFVADASHQLLTPLAAQRLRLENLERKTSPEGRADLDGALDELARLSVLVEGLLELSRAGQHRSSPEPVDTSSLAAARRDAWSALAEERGVTIALDLHDARALATPGRLEQVLDNLLNNALDVAPHGSTIELATNRVDGEVSLTVSDEGPGLSEEQRARAFDRFWRADGAKDPADGGGFGLGLAIVRQLVVTDGGTVALHPSDGGGLQVEVTLPAAP
jgi:signal transduction histidine kinase